MKKWVMPTFPLLPSRPPAFFPLSPLSFFLSSLLKIFFSLILHLTSTFFSPFRDLHLIILLSSVDIEEEATWFDVEINDMTVLSL